MTLFNSNTKHRYSIRGDEWQIDARVIKWQGWAQLLGLTAQYRLERLSGRYTDIEQEKQQARTLYSLTTTDRIDYWQLLYNYKPYIPWVDAYYGSAAYLPMFDGASYILSINQTGLIARPKDEVTRQQINLW